MGINSHFRSIHEQVQSVFYDCAMGTRSEELRTLDVIGTPSVEADLPARDQVFQRIADLGGSIEWEVAQVENVDVDRIDAQSS